MEAKTLINDLPSIVEDSFGLLEMSQLKLLGLTSLTSLTTSLKNDTGVLTFLTNLIGGAISMARPDAVIPSDWKTELQNKLVEDPFYLPKLMGSVQKVISNLRSLN